MIPVASTYSTLPPKTFQPAVSHLPTNFHRYNNDDDDGTERQRLSSESAARKEEKSTKIANSGKDAISRHIPIQQSPPRRVWSMLQLHEMEVIHNLQDDMERMLSLRDEELHSTKLRNSSGSLDDDDNLSDSSDSNENDSNDFLFYDEGDEEEDNDETNKVKMDLELQPPLNDSIRLAPITEEGGEPVKKTNKKLKKSTIFKKLGGMRRSTSSINFGSSKLTEVDPLDVSSHHKQFSLMRGASPDSVVHGENIEEIGNNHNYQEDPKPSSLTRTKASASTPSLIDISRAETSRSLQSASSQSSFRHNPKKKPSQSILRTGMRKATSMMNLDSHQQDQEHQESKENDRKKGLTRTTSFSTLEIREYGITIGDNPGGSSGPPISLDWDYHEEKSLTIDEYETTREPRRQRREMYMNGSIRMWTLMKDLGYSLREIQSAADAADLIRKKRSKSIKYHGIHKLQYKVGKMLSLHK